MHEALPPSLDTSDLAAAFDELNPHEIRLIAGLGAAELQACLAVEPPCRPVLSLDLGPPAPAEHFIALALTQMSRAVASLWPFLWGGEDLSAFRDDALSRAHLPIRLATVAERLPSLSRTWAVETVLRLLRGRQTLARGVAPTLEWAQLALAFAPGGLTLVVPVVDDHAAADRIWALDWLARHAHLSIVALTEAWPTGAGFERILYRARRVLGAPRLGSTDATRFGRRETEVEAVVLVLPPAPEGRPHPMSPIEQRLYGLIQADDELRPLFVFNKTVPDLPFLNARADLVWLDGRVAVEIDGHEHRSVAKFRADRHRDYELMCAGYRVLRITNEEVETDAGLAIEKIRRVARLAGTEAR